MCLAIPARLVAYLDDDRQYGRVELGGVQRRVNTTLLVGDDVTEVGEHVLVHVGFALSRISEEEAAETIRILETMGPLYTDELEQINASVELAFVQANEAPVPEVVDGWREASTTGQARSS